MDFSNLTPLVHGIRTSGKINPLALVLTTDESGGVLSIKGNIEQMRAASISEAALIKELRRVSIDNSFNVSWGQEATSTVSLSAFPHIALMLKSVDVLEDEKGDKIVFSELEAHAGLKIKQQEDGNLSPTFMLCDEEGNVLQQPKFVNDSMVLDGNTLYAMKSVGPNFAGLKTVLEPFPPQLLESYLSIFLTYFDNVTVEYKGRRALYSTAPAESVPTIVLERVAADQALYMRLIQTAQGSDSNGLDGNMAVSKQVTVDGNGQIRVRGIEPIDLGPYAQRLNEMLRHSSPTSKDRREIYVEDGLYIVPRATAAPFLYTYLPQILSEFRLLGSDKLKEYKVSPSNVKLKVKLSSGIDFLEGDVAVDVNVNGEEFTLRDLLEQYAKNRYVTLSDGNRVIVDERYVKRLRRLFDTSDKKGKVKISLFDLPEIEELLDGKLQGIAVAKTRKLYEGFNELRQQALPKLKVNAALRPYQQEGVKWIKYLYDNELGGCLADDMGLGKTLQTIGMLVQIYPDADKPTLIVMPRSLLFNWQQELRRFAPQIEQATYYGPDRDLTQCFRAQVVLTTYAMVRNDIDEMRKLEWEYIVLDESQNIKNVGSQTAQAVSILNARHRMALSGTPMENNLTELYSLFRFLNPTMFGTLDDFNAKYTVPIQRGGDKDAMSSLRRKIFPFMLRRLKADVLDDLPDRIEQNLYVEMSPNQAELYERRRKEYREQISQTVAAQGVQKSQFVMFQALNELRQIASIPENASNGRISSPKIELLRDNIVLAVDNGHKVVVFFNFLAGIELLGDELDKLGITYETMTGSTTANRRKNIVHCFQTNPDCKVLIMTLKVGGVGLNLTAADTVFIAEPWWNKAAEEQAINRLHRIGQKNVVSSYSIITKGTIEEKILQLQEMKKELFDGLIEADGSSSKQLSQEDINFILS